MKHGKLRKLLALVLVLCMSVSLVVPAYAAGGSSSAHSAFGRSLIQSWNSFWDKLFGGSDDAGDADLTLVEDETTVEPGTALRASTYALDTPSAQADTTTLKYFPVTLYDYEATTINNATHQAEVDAGLGSTWNGIYFSSGAPAAESYSYVSNDGKTTAWKPVALSDVNSNDTYVIVGYRGQALTGQSASITGVATGYSGGAVIARDTNAMGSATKWKISMSGSRYQISTVNVAVLERVLCPITYSFGRKRVVTVITARVAPAALRPEGTGRFDTGKAGRQLPAFFGLVGDTA